MNTNIPILTYLFQPTLEWTLEEFFPEHFDTKKNTKL